MKQKLMTLYKSFVTNQQLRFRIFLLISVAIIGAVQVRQLGYTKAAALAYRTRFTDARMIREYFNAHQVRKLQLGAGPHNPEGWLNSDIEPTDRQIYLDASARYPFSDGSFHYIFAEHLIEHLPWEGGLAMLKECHRVLVPEGKIRLHTPNLLRVIQFVTHSGEPETRVIIEAVARRFGWSANPVLPAYVFNKGMREWGHQFIYDPATLKRTLELAGFRDIKEFPVTEKSDPAFIDAEYRTRTRVPKDMWITNEWGTMAFEAVK